MDVSRHLYQHLREARGDQLRHSAIVTHRDQVGRAVHRDIEVKPGRLVALIDDIDVD
jgi:hypothetical protein